MRGIGVAAVGILVAGLSAASLPAAADPGGPEAGLMQRDSADAVRLAQRALQSGGYYPGDIDGLFGPLTLQAVRQFQHVNGLSVTGRLEYRTMAALTLTDPMPSYGGSGANQLSDVGGR
jgi:peptidoglycan hydrolase-like protein with peptidoglycan-binding domain